MYLEKRRLTNKENEILFEGHYRSCNGKMISHKREHFLVEAGSKVVESNGTIYTKLRIT